MCQLIWQGDTYLILWRVVLLFSISAILMIPSAV